MERPVACGLEGRPDASLRGRAGPGAARLALGEDRMAGLGLEPRSRRGQRRCVRPHPHLPHPVLCAGPGPRPPEGGLGTQVLQVDPSPGQRPLPVPWSVSVLTPAEPQAPPFPGRSPLREEET